jgi:hypothetical protein
MVPTTSIVEFAALFTNGMQNSRVRAALVGMMQQPDGRTSPLQRHLERFDRQMPIVDRTDRPAHDES